MFTKWDRFSRNAGNAYQMFHELIRNPLYHGKLFIPKYSNEPAQLVQGLHEPLISESLFDKVQVAIDGKRHLPRPNVKILSDSNLSLGGFLECPECGNVLTGSASKGRNNRYYYYHCRTPCRHRQKAVEANDFIEKGIMQLELNNPMKKFVTKLFLDNYKKFVRYPVSQKKKVVDEIDLLNQRLSVARNKLLSGVIDDDEYLQIKAECKEKIEGLEETLSKDDSDSKIVDIENLVKDALKSIVNIGKVYKEGEIETKRSIIGSIFPEKIMFDGKQCRTTRINVVAKYIFQSFSTLRSKKTGKMISKITFPV